ncbi:MAG: hypothetical protein QF471_01515 [Phycisphaerales bacterium]|jgi:hypothetical protein|nr:hypothetical protein [Phycisphaerales bacterium]
MPGYQTLSAALDRLGISHMPVGDAGSLMAELPADPRVVDHADAVAGGPMMVRMEYSASGDRVLVGWLDCVDLADAPYPLEAAQAMVAANRHLAMVRFEMDNSTRKVSVVGTIPVGPTADLASALQLVLGDMQIAARELLLAVEFASVCGIVLVAGSQGRPELELADLVQIAGGERGVLSLAGKRDPMAAMKQVAKRAAEGRRPTAGELVAMAGGREAFVGLLVETGRIPLELLR